MQRFGSEYYFVLPAYGAEFQDVEAWENYWAKRLPAARFWPGFAGGGVLGVPLHIPARQRNAVALGLVECHHKAIYGLVLGNPSGRELSEQLSCATPNRPPAWAVKSKLAEAVPNPTVKATVEHLPIAGSERFVLVVPKANRKSLKHMDQVPQWFASFGVNVVEGPMAPATELRSVMQDWFTNPDRSLFLFKIEQGEPFATWQLAVTYYIAEHWNLQERGLDSLHFLSVIDGEPNFRQNWTSNK